jgi:hypothetical protein
MKTILLTLAAFSMFSTNVLAAELRITCGNTKIITSDYSLNRECVNSCDFKDKNSGQNFKLLMQNIAKFSSKDLDAYQLNSLINSDALTKDTSGRSRVDSNKIQTLIQVYVARLIDYSGFTPEMLGVGEPPTFTKTSAVMFSKNADGHFEKTDCTVTIN